LNPARSGVIGGLSQKQYERNTNRKPAKAIKG
jgi:hypothetical protein